MYTGLTLKNILLTSSQLTISLIIGLTRINLFQLFEDTYRPFLQCMTFQLEYS